MHAHQEMAIKQLPVENDLVFMSIPLIFSKKTSPTWTSSLQNCSDYWAATFEKRQKQQCFLYILNEIRKKGEETRGLGSISMGNWG